MPNPFEDSTSLFPDITQAVEVAYEENIENGTAVDIINSEKPDLDDIANQVTETARENGKLGSMASETKDKSILLQFESSFKIAEKLFSRIGAAPPTPEEFIIEGVNFGLLADAFKKMAQQGLEPMLVVAPLIKIANDSNAPFGMPPNWLDLFKNIAADESVPGKLFVDKPEDPCLSISPAINSIASDIKNTEKEDMKNNDTVHTVRKSHSSGGVLWTASVVPVKNKAPASKLITQGFFGGQDPDSGNLQISLSQYLCLQAMRAENGNPLVDEAGTFDSSCTVVSPTLYESHSEDTKSYMYGFYNSTSGQIVITTTDGKNDPTNLGDRDSYNG